LLQDERDAPKRLKRVVVAETFKTPDVRLETVVVAKVEVPVTTKELVVVALVKVAFVAVRVVKNAVAALRSVEKKLVDVAEENTGVSVSV
jgi:hypothetical protein